jgi:ferredoxin-type protein NapF
MLNKSLKWARLIIALAFFLLTTLLFTGIKGVLSYLDTGTILYLQFVPSLLKFLLTFGLASLGFAVVLVLTSLFGRLYCSAICPLGILQDFISRIGKLFRKRKKYKYSKPHNLLRNILLAVSVIAGVSGFIGIVNILDPYSVFGKIGTGIFRPVALWINNLASGILESMNIYAVSLIDQPPVSYSIVFPVIVIIVLIIMAGRFGRLYCNTLCPVGTLLGWISKISLFKIKINTTSCTKCGKCSFACKSQCINIKDLSVDHSRCVSCFNCLAECRDNAISFGTGRKNSPVIKEVKPETDLGKRAFIATSVAGILLSGGLKSLYASDNTKPKNKKPTTVPIRKTTVASPPGSLSIAHFTSVCTGCQLCVGHCPTGVLQPSTNEFGITGFMQVFMDNSSQYCNYECVKCSEVCPTGAILPILVDAKKLTQIGKVTFIKDNCVVYTEETACGSCSEHCPTQAVKMVPYKGNITIPEIDNTYCVGCGACEHACPVRPYKAIYVDGNLIHQIAKEPVKKKLEEPQKTEKTEEFPF